MKSLAKTIIGMIVLIASLVINVRGEYNPWTCLDKTSIMYPDGGDIELGLFPNKSEAHITISGDPSGARKFYAYQTPASYIYTVYRRVQIQAWYTYANGSTEMVLNESKFGREGIGASCNVFACTQNSTQPGQQPLVKFTMVITIYDSVGRFVCSNMANFYCSAYFPNFPK
jgi:hypothetical protein